MSPDVDVSFIMMSTSPPDPKTNPALLSTKSNRQMPGLSFDGSYIGKGGPSGDTTPLVISLTQNAPVGDITRRGGATRWLHPMLI